MRSDRRSNNGHDEMARNQQPEPLFPLLDLPPEIITHEVSSNISRRILGLFAQTCKKAEAATAYERLLEAVLYAEPESYTPEAYRDDDKRRALTPESYQIPDVTNLAAIAILKRHPALLFQEMPNGKIVKDHHGRKCHGSLYQLAWATGDSWMVDQIHKEILPLIENGTALAAEHFKKQFPTCESFDPYKGEAQLYDARNKKMMADLEAQLEVIVAAIDADPCTNGFATLPATTAAIKALRQLFAANDDEISTGLHFPLGIMHALCKVHHTHLRPWSFGQLAFFSREVIGSAEAALTAVDGQCCKNGLQKLDYTQGPNRRDGLICKRPQGLPVAIIAEKSFKNHLGQDSFVSPCDGETCSVSTLTTGHFRWYTQDGASRESNQGIAGSDELGRFEDLMRSKNKQRGEVLRCNTSPQLRCSQ